MQEGADGFLKIGICLLFSALCQVQRPGALHEVALDLVILRSAVGAARRIAGINQDVRRIVDELGNGLFGKFLVACCQDGGHRKQVQAVRRAQS